MPNNYVAIRVNILNIYQADLQMGFIDADVTIELEWMDDRLLWSILI